MRLAAGIEFIDAQPALLDDFVQRIPLRCAVGTGRFAAAATDGQGRVDIDHAVLFRFQIAPVGQVGLAQ